MAKYTEYQVRVDDITHAAFGSPEGAEVAVKLLIEQNKIEAKRITIVKVKSG